MLSKAQIMDIKSSFDASRQKTSGFAQDDYCFCAASKHGSTKSIFLHDFRIKGN